MKITFALIKKIVTILSTATSFFSFIVTNLYTNIKSPNYIEYTDLSKFFLNLYIGLLLFLIFIHSIYPKIVCTIFTDRIGIITSNRGKMVLMTTIIIMYFSTDSLPQQLFGMISFVCVLALLLAESFLNCEILEQKPLMNEKIVNNANANTNISQVVITTTNNAINNTVEKEN